MPARPMWSILFHIFRAKEVGAHAVARKISCLATFYKWAKRNNKVTEDPIYQIEKPKRPRRIPVWLEIEEQAALTKATRNYDDIPDNVFGRSRAFSMAVRQRYELLFELFQKSGLRISEALGLKVQHIRVVDGVAKHVRVIGKGNKERQVPLARSVWPGAGVIAGWQDPRGLCVRQEARRQTARRPCYPRLFKEADRESRHRQESHAAQAPAYLRHPLAGKRRATGGYSGLARP